MKRLTTAYKDEDLHTMLRLEVEWMVREQADAGRLTDAKLAVYNGVLKEQISELEEELRAIGAHPRYEPLHRLSPEFFIVGIFDRAAAQRMLRREADAVDRSIRALRSNEPAKIQAALRSFLEDLDDIEAEDAMDGFIRDPDFD